MTGTSKISYSIFNNQNEFGFIRTVFYDTLMTIIQFSDTGTKVPSIKLQVYLCIVSITIISDIKFDYKFTQRSIYIVKRGGLKIESIRVVSIYFTILLLKLKYDSI